MELIPWRPFRELGNLRREMDRLWDEFFGRGREIVSTRGEWMPSVDLSETKNNIIVKANLPGMEAKDIDISISGDTLTIKGESRKEKEEEDENYHMKEMRYGSFLRSVRIPVPVDSNKVKADYKKGVLKITLPKKEEAKTKKIEIKTEG